MNEEYYEKIWDALREFGRRLTGLPKEEDNMQNINGQWVDVDAIERNRNYFDKDFDASDWCDFDAETDENYELIMTIRKAQYDAMVDSMYTLKQQYTWARRMADKYSDEVADLKEQVLELQEYIIKQVYMSGWFDCLEKNDDLTEYEQNGVPADHQLPFSYETLDKLYTVGITRPMLVEYAKKKYTEWKANKESEGEEIEEA